VFLLQKFCTPHLADEPVLRRALAQEGIRSLVVELEATGIHTGQLTTRLQSFVEMLKES
jgi:benzoyl-CoA reductase/2-hydroxyglutaryl-CoA dehydratase subunit BcrC/BadD/HgdB